MKYLLILILTALGGVSIPRQTPLLAQTAGALSESDVAQISSAISAYIRANYQGKLAFDVGMTCKFGRACDEPAAADKKAIHQKNQQLLARIKDGARGATIPLKSANKCASSRRESCRLLADYYFQIFEPTISTDAARFGMWVSQDSPGLKAGDYYMGTNTLTLDLAKANGQWRVTGTKTHPTT